MFLGIFFYLLAAITSNSIQSTMDSTSNFAVQAATQKLAPMIHINKTISSTTWPYVVSLNTSTPTSTPPLPTPTPTPTPTILPTEAPIPTAAPTAVPASPDSPYESLFDQYSAQYGADKEVMKRIARCESGYNPTSRNGIYGGMFQFAESTWTSTRNQMGMDASLDLRFSAEEAIRSAAFKIGNGGVGAWSGCL
jgi:hypothetical protein